MRSVLIAATECCQRHVFTAARLAFDHQGGKLIVAAEHEGECAGIRLELSDVHERRTVETERGRQEEMTCVQTVQEHVRCEPGVHITAVNAVQDLVSGRRLLRRARAEHAPLHRFLSSPPTKVLYLASDRQAECHVQMVQSEKGIGCT